MELCKELRFLSEQDVLRLLTPADAIAATEDTFLHIGLGDITVGSASVLSADKEKNNSFHSMPATLHHRRIVGIKWIGTYFSPMPGYPFSHGTLVVLNETGTGSPVAIVGATNITAMRTAGGHGVVQAKHLCNPEPTALTVIGCGTQAKAGIQGFLTQFPSLKQIRLYSRSRAPMEQVKAALAERVETVLCDSPEQALQGSNLLLMASGAHEPLVTLDMIRPGSTIIGIEGFRDLDPRVGKQADKWFLGYKKADEYILNSPQLNPKGYLTSEDVYGDMTELLTGKANGREREEEIIVSTHMGMGAHDVSCAAVVYERAREQRVGQVLILG